MAAADVRDQDIHNLNINNRGEKSSNKLLKKFTYNELEKATEQFNKEYMIGEGGFGAVYKGFLGAPDATDSKIPVAVKIHNRKKWQGHSEWEAEIKYGQLQHVNVIKLHGYCNEGGPLMLVYEYMPKFSVDKYLFHSGKKSTYESLSWRQRTKIAVGAAKGLEFLHCINVLHLDFKSSNVLLDGDFTAKISDFGLAVDDPSPRGSRKTDVHSFGMFLFELLSSKRKEDILMQVRSVKWGKPTSAQKAFCENIVDKTMEYNKNAAFSIGRLAWRCIDPRIPKRPTMSQVVSILEGRSTLEDY